MLKMLTNETSGEILKAYNDFIEMEYLSSRPYKALEGALDGYGLLPIAFTDIDDECEVQVSYDFQEGAYAYSLRRVIDDKRAFANVEYRRCAPGELVDDLRCFSFDEFIGNACDALGIDLL